MPRRWCGNCLWPSVVCLPSGAGGRVEIGTALVLNRVARGSPGGYLTGGVVTSLAHSLPTSHAQGVRDCGDLGEDLGMRQFCVRELVDLQATRRCLLHNACALCVHPLAK